LATIGLAAAAPTAITGPVTGIGPTSATLAGTVNPNGASTSWYFEYGTSTSYGTKTGARSAGSGTANASVSTSVSGLRAGTTYHYRLVATSSAGTGTGSDGIFTTALPPSATTGSASRVGPTSATVSGTANPNGLATTVLFEYGTSTSYGSRTAAQDVGSGTGNRSVAAALTGLAPGRTYHFRVVATSAAGTTSGADATFATQPPPSVQTTAASSIAATTATPNGRSTSWYFEYGTTTGYGTKTAAKSAGSGTGTRAVSTGISGLTAGTVYHFRLVAVSDAGTTAGADASFTTQPPPSVVTGPPSGVTATSANVSGTVNPNGRSTSWWVEYGTSTAYGSQTSSRGIGSGRAAVPVSVTLTGLRAGTVYHYRVLARNGNGTSTGADATFATPGQPAVATGAAQRIGPFRALATGAVNPAGQPTTYWFEYGRTTDYGFRTPAASAGSGTANVGVSARLVGLAQGAVFHYRLVAQNPVGTATGADAVLLTPELPHGPNGRLVRCTITGTTGPDVIRGTRGRDVICSFGGRDRILARGGNDVVFSGAGRDTVLGGTGNDTLYGGAEGDALYGGEGRDRLYGGPGPDLLFGRDGRRDFLNGGLGADWARVDRKLDRRLSIARLG
jgi:phosphodiesterase/alkaline phosphatase D-like protein